MMYLQGTDKLWISKEMKSIDKLKKIADIYPNAKFIITFRDSSSFMNSLLRLIKYSTLCKTGINVENLTWWKTAMLSTQKRDCQLQIEFVKSLSPNRQIHIPFEIFTQHLIFNVKHIYKFLESNISASELLRLEKLENQQKTRDKGYDYKKEKFDEFEFFDSFTQKVKEKHSSSLTNKTL